MITIEIDDFGNIKRPIEFSDIDDLDILSEMGILKGLK